MLMRDERRESTPNVVPVPPLAVIPEAKPALDPIPDEQREPRRLHTAAWFGLSFLAVAFAVALAGLGAPDVMTALVGYGGLGLFAASILIAIVRAMVGFVALVRGEAVPGTLAAVVGNLVMAGFALLGTALAFLSTMAFSRGRQLRRFGRVLLPGLRSSTAWSDTTVLVESDEPVPAGLADQWRENGKTEHASVAAFARLTLDLMALGAPPSLIAAANQDALDEIRHAELCFSLARTLDGQGVSPAPFPEAQRAGTLPPTRPLALATLAVDSLIDGALHEGVSARIIAALARRCEMPGVRAMLREIAADEGRHSAHGWAVVQWCLDTGGRPVAEALRGAIRALPKQMRTELPAAAANGGWERWGIHGHELEADEYAEALAHVTQRVQAMAAESKKTAA